MGILVGIVSAFTTSLVSVFLKKITDLRPSVLTWIRMAAAAPVLSLLVTFFHGWAIPILPFWLIMVFGSVPLEIFLAYLTTKSVQMAPLSVVAPLGVLSSIFLIPVGYFVLGELPTRIGLVGVLFIVMGSFFLGWERGKGNFQYGLANILRYPGSWIAVAAGFVASVTVTAAKYSLHYASPLLSAFYLTALMAIVLIPYFMVRPRIFKQVRMHTRDATGLAVVSGSSIAFHYIGISLIPVVYFISIKRLSALISVFWGKFLFDEGYTDERLIGAGLMVGGVILIALG